MACDTQLKPRQTIQQRAVEVRKAMVSLEQKLASGLIRPVVGPQGALAFQGWAEADRDGVTDACAYRQIMARGTVSSKAVIARAEQLAGRSVDKQALKAGIHSHDGGASWGSHK